MDHQSDDGTAWIRITGVAGAATVLLPTLALIGWGTGATLLTAGRPGLIPMAPSTALLFVVLGFTTLLCGRTPGGPRTRSMLAAVAGLSTGAALLLLILALSGIRWSVEHLGFSIEGSVGNAPIGHISPLTAATFALAGIGLLLLATPRGDPDRPAVGSFGLGITVALSGAVLVVGYLLRTPLLYGSRAIPPAATTSVAFLFLGIALAGAAALRLGSAGGYGRHLDPRLVLAIPFIGAALIVAPAYALLQGGGMEQSLGLLVAPVAVLFLTAVGLAAFVWQRSEARHYRLLSEAQRRYRRLFEEAPVGIFRTRSDGRVLGVNPTMARMLGFDGPEEAIAHYRDLGAQLYVNPERRRHFVERLREEGSVRDFDYQARTRNGDRIWLRMDAQVSERGPDGSFQVHGFCWDITARHMAEAAVRRQQAMLARTERLAGIGSWELDVATGTVSWSREMFRIIGLDPHAPAPSFEEHRRFFSSEDMARVEAAVGRLIETGEPYRLDLTLVRPDGTRRETRAEGYAKLEPGGRATSVFGFLADVTDEVAAERSQDELRRQLSQAQKMESVGRLAGGVAHDFNNMLSVILGNVELVMEHADGNPPLRSGLDEIWGAAQRSADLTRQLLAFAREEMIQPRVLDLNETVTGMLAILDRLIGEDIELRWEPGEDLGPIRMDPAQIDQILANLLVNAQDSIDGPGTITIETARRRLEPGAEDDADEATIDYVMLAVSDSGSGMDGDTVARIFDPFFTTKGPGEGTGLGLATVHGVVKQNHGRIEVDSEPGEGTVFRLYFPREADAVEESESRLGPTRELPDGGRASASS